MRTDVKNHTFHKTTSSNVNETEIILALIKKLWIKLRHAD